MRIQSAWLMPPEMKAPFIEAGSVIRREGRWDRLPTFLTSKKPSAENRRRCPHRVCEPIADIVYRILRGGKACFGVAPG
jgi:hypothetical protein